MLSALSRRIASLTITYRSDTQRWCSAMAKGGFYAVRRGRKIGVFTTWTECETLVKGYEGARYKKFATKAEAEKFVSEGTPPKSTVPKQPVKRTAVTSQPTKSFTAAKVLPEDFDNGPPRKLIKTDENDDRPVVYTDGACSGNGKSGARAGIGVFWGKEDQRNVSEALHGRPTNNRAEIHATIRAITQAKQQGFDKLEIRTDSKFLIDSITKWVPNWSKKGWRTASGGEVKNKEDFKELVEAMEGIDVKWTHVPGHAGVEGNESADRLAVAGMDNITKG